MAQPPAADERSLHLCISIFAKFLTSSSTEATGVDLMVELNKKQKTKTFVFVGLCRSSTDHERPVPEISSKRPKAVETCDSEQSVRATVRETLLVRAGSARAAAAAQQRCLDLTSSVMFWLISASVRTGDDTPV